ncbi:MAG: hypothetical protein IJ168_06660 [Eubacterium sp.]|nr:hypothetical protein [Eubacterium sp.]
MKKIMTVLIAVCLVVCSFSGCGLAKAIEQSKTVQKTAADVDLTTLTSTMVYSEVYNMLMTPEEYEGKTVRMKGAFTSFEDPDTGNVYYACIIADATACCQQGLEFVPQAQYRYPEDYPEEYGDIEVYGTFEQYEENGLNYVRLVDCELEPLQPAEES